ncbi:MAG: PhoH family protein [bacterium]
MVQERFVLADEDEVLRLCGKDDENLRIIQNAFASKIIPKGTQIILLGEKKENERILSLLNSLLLLIRNGHLIRSEEIKYALRLFEDKEDILGVFEDTICVSERGRLVKPKSINQRKYVEMMKKNDLVIAIGPAGTGKTYLAVAMALSSLLIRRVERIILARPAVEAGERLGFLPGDLQEKVNPYLRPLYDALYDMMGIEKFHKMFENGVIEIAPLAYMRGRTLNDSFVILDEAQNTTSEQMKMFLTRLGFDSKAVITGDITQIDLSSEVTSGLVEIQEILKGVSGIGFSYLDKSDVVRHPLVSKIIKAYEEKSKVKSQNWGKNL